MELPSPLEQNAIPRKPIASKAQSITEDTFISQEEAAKQHPATERQHEAGSDWPRSTWTPTLNRRRIICGFLLVHILLIVAVSVLAFYSAHNQGLATAEAKLRYSWTYGPTAVFTLLAALWNRVDYRFRQIAPWAAMSSMVPQPASQSILLDYLSPIRPSIVWQSLKHQHWIVFYSSLVTLLNTLLIVVSTGLFALDTTYVQLDSVPYTTSTKFNDTWAFFPGRIAKAEFSTVAVTGLGLNYPLGTTPLVAYQPFNSSTLPAGAVMQAEVDVMTFGLECKAAGLFVDYANYSWRYKRPSTEGPAYCEHDKRLADSPPLSNSSITARSQDCEIDVSLPFDYEYLASGETQWYASLASRRCTASTDQSEGARLLLAVGRARLAGSVGPRLYDCPESAPIADIEFLQPQQWTCKPDVAITRANVTYNATTILSGEAPEINIDPNSERHPLKGIDYSEFLSTTLLSIDGALGPVYKDPRPLPVRFPDANYTPSYITLALRDAPGLTEDDLLATDAFYQLMQRFFFKYQAQKALFTNHMLPVNSTVLGTALVKKQRLFIQTIPLRLIQTALGLQCVLLCLTIIGISKYYPCWTSRDPANLSGMIAPLAHSHGLRSCLSKCGLKNEDEISSLLSEKAFRIGNTSDADGQASNNNAPLLVLVSSRVRYSSVRSKVKPRVREHVTTWWRPILVWKRVKLPVFFVIACIVVTLQVLLKISNDNEGIVDVSSKQSVKLSWTILPALCMVAISLYIGIIANFYKTIIPFWHLRRVAKTPTPLFTNYPALTEIEVFWSSLRNKEVCISLLTACVILASFLTAITSGVFSREEVMSGTSVQLAQQPYFNKENSADDGSAGNNALVAALVLGAGLNYPTWTYEHLAFPRLEFSDPMANNTYSRAPSTLRLTIQALRPALDCTVYQQDDAFEVVFKKDRGRFERPAFVTNLPGPAHCTGQDEVVYEPSFYKLSGGFMTLIQSNSTDCPSLTYLWGHYKYDTSEDLRKLLNVTVLRCYERIEQVNVDLSLQHPAFDIAPNTPPSVIEGSAKLFSNNLMPLSYDRMPKLGLDLRLLSRDAIPIVGGLVAKFKFSTSNVGEDGLEIDAISDASKADVIASSIQDIHKIIRAQQYHGALRQDASIEDQLQPLTGIVSYPRSRLVQHAVSTHILSCLLGAILVLALAGSSLKSAKYVLPKNPSSIAALVSLLADSTIFEPLRRRVALPSGIEKMSDDDLRREGIYAGLWFKLWRRSADGEDTFVLDVVEADVSAAADTATLGRSLSE